MVTSYPSLRRARASIWARFFFSCGWLLDRLWQEWKQLETDIEAISGKIERISNEDARCQRLRQIPGFGPLISTATVAAVGNGAAFRRGRDFAALRGDVERGGSPQGIPQPSRR